MAFRPGLFPALAAIGLVLCGALGTLASQEGLWGLLTGTLLLSVWLGMLLWWDAMRPRAAAPAEPGPGESREVVLRALLDAAPTPLVAIQAGAAGALNRAARTLFGADDRILPLPGALLDPGTNYVRHEGRRWRIDRVVPEGGAGRTIAALIDVEQEERAAEARAASELIQVLGHELLNGLSPIVSLAESGLAAVARAEPDRALLSEILGTLARQAEGLQRFTASYRELARLPEPVSRHASLVEISEDLARLFQVRWPEIALRVDVPDGLAWRLDRDQIGKALWALLQNAAESVSAAAGTDGGVTLRARQTQGGLAIEVEDDGEAVPTDVAAKIFRPFHTTKPQGSGIGLSLARQIAHGHGGTLTLQPGAPTTFLLILPRR